MTRSFFRRSIQRTTRLHRAMVLGVTVALVVIGRWGSVAEAACSGTSTNATCTGTSFTIADTGAVAKPTINVSGFSGVITSV